MALGWELDLKIELSVVLSWALTFDSRLVKNKTLKRPESHPKKACNAPNKKVSWPSPLHKKKSSLYYIGFGSEWFWINWFNQNPAQVEFMKQNYPPNFTYQDFGPQLSMEFFNATWFAELIADAGAK